MADRHDRGTLIEALTMFLGIFVTLAFLLFAILEWQLLDLSSSVAPYYFGVTFLLWALVLLSIGYWYQGRRRSREEHLRDELRAAYARGDLTTEEFRERREYFDWDDDRH